MPMKSSANSQFVSYRALMGQTVVRHRNVRGVSQAQLAAKLRITPASLSRLETGQSAFSIDQLAVAAHALATSPRELTAEADEFASKLAKQGYNVVRTLSDAKEDWTPLVGAALFGVLIGLAISGKK